ncbi:MAG: coproporphyrinogen III oxidase, partial [Pseudomonadota bacterium]|nr:coproporphyrinogen III oxidase [Pseudomonadota bacterium]
MSPAAPISPETACPIHLLRTWSRSDARFPTYPGVDQFSTSFGYRDFLQTVAGLRTRGSHNVLALSLYLPGFDTAPERPSPHRHGAEPDPSAVYLGYLKRECEMQGQLFAGMNRIEQLSLRGSGAALLSNAQISALMQHLRHCFQFAPDSIGVYTVEVDVEHLTAQRLEVLRRAGFNHVRLPFQDIAPMQSGLPDGRRMQRHALAGIDQLRAASFRSIHVDLLMGCAHQNLMMLSRALKVMIDAGVDRIVLQDMASRIESDCHARSMVDALRRDLDASANRAQCMWQLDQAGYINIGMDHFVRPGDPLAVAQAQGRLHANLEGFSARADYDLI